jgi:hypothetical protein
MSYKFGRKYFHIQRILNEIKGTINSGKCNYVAILHLFFLILIIIIIAHLFEVYLMMYNNFYILHVRIYGWDATIFIDFLEEWRKNFVLCFSYNCSARYRVKPWISLDDLAPMRTLSLYLKNEAQKRYLRAYYGTFSVCVCPLIFTVCCSAINKKIRYKATS